MSRVRFYPRLFLRYLEFWCYPPESCYSRIAALYYEYGDYRKAVSLFLKSETSHGGRDKPLARYNSYLLGYAYWNLGELQQANRYFEKYFQLDKGNWQIATTIAWYYAAISQKETALAWYQQTLTLEPRLFAARTECARICHELGRLQEALQYVDEAMSNAETLFERQIAEAIRLKISGDPSQAIKFLKAVVSQADAMWNSQQLQKNDACMLLSRFQREAGDTKGALETLRSAARGGPLDPWLTNELAMEYAEQGICLVEALSLADDALKLQPDNAIFFDTKGQILLKLGRNEEAEAAIERSRKLLPEYHGATIHWQRVSKY
jgi:tetratricopeptide (TPR) repeat protein